MTNVIIKPITPIRVTPNETVVRSSIKTEPRTTTIPEPIDVATTQFEEDGDGSEILDGGEF